MSDEHANDQVPRGALISIGLLLAVTLLAVTAVRLSGVEVREPDAPAMMTRELRFEDRPDGSIAVIDPATGKLVESVSGEQGFLRGALRALARERKQHGLGPEQPFELVGRTNGRLTLHDHATGARIDLESFGPTNAGVFGRLLMQQPVKPSTPPQARATASPQPQQQAQTTPFAVPSVQ